jgi:hypothetical protein
LRRWQNDDLDGFAAVNAQPGELAGFTGLAVPTFLPEITGSRHHTRLDDRGLANPISSKLVCTARHDRVRS